MTRTDGCGELSLGIVGPIADIDGMTDQQKDTEKPAAVPQAPAAPEAGKGGVKDHGPAQSVTEIGGRGGADPTRYGDWEINGRCVDF